MESKQNDEASGVPALAAEKRVIPSMGGLIANRIRSIATRAW
jgi:hypothetical protein